MNDYFKGFKFTGILAILMSIGFMLSHNPIGPIAMFIGIIFITFNIIIGKEQNTASAIILAATIAVMFLLEYFLVELQDITIYLLLIVWSICLFTAFYYSLKPPNQLTKRENYIIWAIIILSVACLAYIIGISYNINLSLVTGFLVFIIAIIGILIRKKFFISDKLDDEFDESSITKEPKEYWYKYKTWGMKPVRWQGWALYGIIFLSLSITLIFVRDATISVAMGVAIIFVGIIITIIKSDYIEWAREIRKNLYNQKK